MRIHRVAACLSGSTLFLINEFTLQSTLGPVSTGMGDHLPAGKPARFVTAYSSQLSLLPSARPGPCVNNWWRYFL